MAGTQMDYLRPYDTIQDITLDADLPEETEALICTTAGDIVLMLNDGAGSTTNITMTLTLHQIINFCPVQIVSTGTTGVVKALS